MPKFIVNIREVWIQPVIIEADTHQEAIKAVEYGEGEQMGGMEYSHTRDSSTWTIKGPNDDVDKLWKKYYNE
jgi:hypothetical protein